MRKIILSSIAVAITFLLPACKKTGTTSSAKTVQNLSGSYKLSSLIWSSGGISANVYDSLPACEKDNIIQLNSNLTANFIDTGVVCTPSLSAQGTWSLSSKADSIYFDGQGAFIKSWDGKTLVYTGIVDNGPPLITGTTTLVKQ
jgi:hypothetical protein